MPHKCSFVALLLLLLGCGATLPDLRLGEPVPAAAKKTDVMLLEQHNDPRRQDCRLKRQPVVIIRTRR